MTDLWRRMCGKAGRVPVLIPVLVSVLVLSGVFAGIGGVDGISGIGGGFGIGQTWAYYTGSDVSDSSVSVGFCDVEILEEGKLSADIPAGRAFRIVDAVRVSNTGTLPCFIRAAVDYDCYLTEAASTVTDMSDKWVYDPDTMFWYYTGRLLPGEKSELLMSGIDVSPLPDWLAEGYRVGVYVEAIDDRGGWE